MSFTRGERAGGERECALCARGEGRRKIHENFGINSFSTQRKGRESLS